MVLSSSSEHCESSPSSHDECDEPRDSVIIRKQNLQIMHNTFKDYACSLTQIMCKLRANYASHVLPLFITFWSIKYKKLLNDFKQSNSQHL